VQLDDGAVDTGGQPKVVGIEDETAHRVSVSTRGAALRGRCSGEGAAGREASALL
jgi:hypothetical protein